MREGEFPEFVFDEELFPLEGVIPEFNLETGWECEMVRDKFLLVYETYRGQHREIQKDDIPNIVQMLNDMYENSD